MYYACYMTDIARSEFVTRVVTDLIARLHASATVDDNVAIAKRCAEALAGDIHARDEMRMHCLRSLINAR
jgi:ABC-type uncharacterized transport system ATPase component